MDNKTIIGIVSICCIGLIVLIAISGMFSPDKPTSTNISPTNNTNTSTPSPTNSSSSQNVSNSSSNHDSGITYVASANSNVFHRPGCRYVNQIKEKNKIYFNSRDEAINAGYHPCEVCNP